jgi:hypothetical protein
MATDESALIASLAPPPLPSHDDDDDEGDGRDEAAIPALPASPLPKSFPPMPRYEPPKPHVSRRASDETHANAAPPPPLPSDDDAAADEAQRRQLVEASQSLVPAAVVRCLLVYWRFGASNRSSVARARAPTLSHVLFTIDIILKCLSSAPHISIVYAIIQL